MKEEIAQTIVSILLTVVPNEQRRRKDTCAKSAAYPDTSFVIVQPNTPLGIRVVQNHVKDTYAVPVEVNYIMWLIVQWRINIVRTSRAAKEDHRKRLDVCPVFHLFFNL